jgi:hypothetical protein
MTDSRPSQQIVVELTLSKSPWPYLLVFLDASAMSKEPEIPEQRVGLRELTLPRRVAAELLSGQLGGALHAVLRETAGADP